MLLESEIEKVHWDFLCRIAILTTENKSVKQQLQTVLNKDRHDNELIEALLVCICFYYIPNFCLPTCDTRDLILWHFPRVAWYCGDMDISHVSHCLVTSVSDWGVSTTTGNYIMPRTHRKLGERAFSVTAPRAWNRLPTELKTSTSSTDSFKRSLKTFLFQSAYGCETCIDCVDCLL